MQGSLPQDIQHDSLLQNGKKYSQNTTIFISSEWVDHIAALQLIGNKYTYSCVLTIFFAIL